MIDYFAFKVSKNQIYHTEAIKNILTVDISHQAAQRSILVIIIHWNKAKSIDFMVFILGSLLKGDLQVKKIFLKIQKCLFDYFVGILMVSLNYHFQIII